MAEFIGVFIVGFTLCSIAGAAGTLLGAAQTANTKDRRFQASMFAGLLAVSTVLLLVQFVGGLA